ncbi:aldehyde dehydrogenase family protein, partial [Mycobacteroides abscessus]
GGASDAESLTIEPTIVVDPDADEPLMQEEIFGPILPIVTAETLDAAIDFINSRPKPLAAYAFTESKYTANRYAAEVPAGGMVINHLLYHAVIPKLPFGGVGASGMGAYHGKAGFDEFSHRKSTLYKSTALDLKLPYPPYTEKNLKLMQRLM